MISDYEYISTPERLEEVVKVCRQKSAVAIDTEFARTNTYYPIVGLIQIFDGEQCYLVDPLAVEDLTALNALMTDTAVIKVFHACSEDMEVFQHCLGVMPKPVFDTQIVAAILGAGFSLSYQRLVEHYLSIHVEKGETRSDWLQRPLTESQLKYAALDVIHLLHVFELQEDLLVRADKNDWVVEECGQLSEDIPTQIDPEAFYLRIKNLWRLDRRQLALVKTLSAWRERTARSENVPRNRVLDEKSLFAVAQLRIDNLQDLKSKTELRHRQLRKFGEEVLDIVDSVSRLSDDQLPELVQRENTPVSGSTLKALKQLVESQAKILNVSVEILAKRRHLEQLIRSKDWYGEYRLPKGLSGWRSEAIGQTLLAALV